jgi:hypothetical protein
MNKFNYFILIELTLFIVVAVIVFRTFKTFFKSLYSIIFRGYYIWSKKLWDEQFERSFKFEFFILILGILTGVNILIFRYLVR